MRIYAAADIHGKASRIDLIKEKALHTGADVIVMAGDITGYIRPAPVIERLNKMPVPVLAVRGNTDLPATEKIFEKYANIYHMDLKKIRIKNIWFAGVSGTVPVPFRSRVRFFEKRAMKKTAALIDEKSVLIAHSPPWGTLDNVFGKFHAGSTGLLGLIRQKQPAVFICGHIHEDPGFELIGPTLVVNCSMGRKGAGFLIEYTGENPASATAVLVD